jgi:RHS repeat-associated protein
MLSTLPDEGVLAPPMPWSSVEVFSLAAEGQVNREKPHQGVTGKKAALHQGAMACNFTIALGVSWRLWSRTTPGATVTYDYDAFGNKINSTGTTPNNMLYRGEELDPDLGLYYLRARYYNSLSGRFMSRDPKVGTPQIPQTLPKYLYANADPIKYADPSGREGEAISYVSLTARSITMAERVATYGCYASIALTSTSLLLAKSLGPWDLAGAAATAYGCVTLSLPTSAESAAGKLALGFKKAVDYGTCALSLATMVHDLNEYINSDQPQERSTTPFFIDTFGTVVGCVATQLGSEFEAEE